MRTILLVIMILGFTSLNNAQTIEKSSIDSGGASALFGGIEILYTLGEVNVQELNAGGIYVSEGFVNDAFEEGLSVAQNDPLEHQVSVYPNPVSEVIYVKSNFEFETAELYDTLGKIYINTTTTSKINVGALATGVYFLKLSAKGKTLTKRIVIYD